MPAFLAPLAIAGVSALAQGLMGPKKTSQDTRSNSTNETNTDNWNVPQYDSYSEELRQRLIDAYGGSIAQDPDLRGYAAQGQSNINQMNDVRSMALRNSLASRGLSHSAIAPLAQQANDNARIGEQSQFLNTIPLLQQQLQQQRLTNAGNFFKGLPVGSHQIGTGVQHGSNQSHTEGTMPNAGGSGAGGVLGAGAETLAGLYGQNPNMFGGGDSSANDVSLPPWLRKPPGVR